MGGEREGVTRAEDADADHRGEGRGWEEDEFAAVVWEAAVAALASCPVLGEQEGFNAWVILASRPLLISSSSLFPPNRLLYFSLFQS